jgi:hypothetical protein
MVSEDIGTIEKKLNNLIQTIRKRTGGHLRNWQDSTHGRLESMKKKTHFKDFPLRTECLRGTLLITGTLRKGVAQDSVHDAQLHRHSQTTTTMVQGTSSYSSRQQTLISST